MASRKQKKATGEADTASAAATDQAQQSAAPAVGATKRKAAKSAVVGRAAPDKRRGPGRPKGSKAKTRAAKHASAKKPSRRRRYTLAERAKILAAAKREGLSGPAAARKFGISQLTYYTWRKKAGGTKARRVGRRRSIRADGSGPIGRDIASTMRQEIRSRISQMLPVIVRAEIDNVLGTAGTRRRRG